MNTSDRLVAYGWMGVYYRQAARKNGFLNKDARECWRLIRQEIVAWYKEEDDLRPKAFDAVPEAERLSILEWLRSRETGGN